MEIHKMRPSLQLCCKWKYIFIFMVESTNWPKLGLLVVKCLTYTALLIGLYKCQVTPVPSVRTSLQSSCWSTEGLCHWSPSPEPYWRPYNRPSLRCALSPVWDKRAGGSVRTACPRPLRQQPAERAPAVSGRQSPAPAQPSALAAVSPFRFHFGAC